MIAMVTTITTTRITADRLEIKEETRELGSLLAAR
jgi:hypothetical protein